MALVTMARLTKTSLNEGLEHLARCDTDMAAAIERFGLPALRRRDPGFRSLFRAIVGQQVSIAAAAAIWARLEAAVDPLTPQALASADDATLRAAGLSRQKIAYGRSLAEDVSSGRVALERLPRMADEDAIEELVRIKGIGRWSAEVYLLFALGRADVFPSDDLALMAATQHMKGLNERPARAAHNEIAEPWRPWRGAAAHMLWHYYHHAIMKTAVKPEVRQ